MEQLITIFKKHGALGVLTCWLWYTHSEVQDLKLRLYDCYKKVENIDVNKKRGSEIPKTVGILPKEFDKRRKLA